MNKETEKILEELGSESDELETLRLEKAIKKNLEEEFALLREIFPERDADDIPDEVFALSENGKNLAAHFALYYLKEEKRKTEQTKKEEENSKSAPPDVKNSPEEAYFTYDEVRNMSEEEIRKNYKNIMKSMEKWN